jgi:hypothetical protein
MGRGHFARSLGFCAERSLGFSAALVLGFHADHLLGYYAAPFLGYFAIGCSTAVGDAPEPELGSAMSMPTKALAG